MKNRLFPFFLLSILIFTYGCQPGWIITVKTNEETIDLNRSDFNDLLGRFPENEYCEGVLLEQAFYEQGIEIIDSVEITTENGDEVVFPWKNSDEYLCLNSKGEIKSNGQTFQTDEVRIDDSVLPQGYARITDIPSTVLGALELPHEDLPGNMLTQGTYQHVALIYLDGLSWKKYQNASEKGLVGSLTDSGITHQAITVYPPRTVTGSAAVLTGLDPEDNGVDRGTIRKTDALTIFDRASKAGISSYAIEGDALAFNLRNAEVTLSGDRDHNGETDDNVFANAMDVIENNMPRLLWIHFHGIDDSGHTYGPDDLKVDEKIIEINNFLTQIYASLPEETLIIYFADHGMHNVNEEGRLGNHGHLIYDDMVIPVIIQTK